MIDRDAEEESSTGETAQPQASDKMDESAGKAPESPETGQVEKSVLWPIVAGIIVLAGIAFAGVSAWKKKKEE